MCLFIVVPVFELFLFQRCSSNYPVSPSYPFTVHPVHCAANLLDPRYKGKNLTDEEVLSAFDWISEHSTHTNLEVGKVYSDVAEYRTNAGIWSRPGIWASANHIPPSTWWEGICTSKTVMPLARNILQIPPSSAACERNWSDFANIHTLRRNRLRNETVQKLVFVHAHLNMMKNSTAEATDTDSE